MHDTMSPVNTIKGSVALLKKGNLSPEDTAKLLDAIEERANALNTILDAYWFSQKTLKELFWKMFDGVGHRGIRFQPYEDTTWVYKCRDIEQALKKFINEHFS